MFLPRLALCARYGPTRKLPVENCAPPVQCFERGTGCQDLQVSGLHTHATRRAAAALCSPNKSARIAMAPSAEVLPHVLPLHPFARTNRPPRTLLLAPFLARPEDRLLPRLPRSFSLGVSEIWINAADLPAGGTPGIMPLRRCCWPRSATPEIHN